MLIDFLLLVNKQGQTRLGHYYTTYLTPAQKSVLEGGLIRKCLSRSEDACSSLTFSGYKIVYRRYASLYFIVGLNASNQQSINELAMLEFIHFLVETFDRYFENVCELDIMFNLEKAHFLLDEMVANGCIIETNKLAVLQPLNLMEKKSAAMV